MPISVVIADDHDVVCQGIISLLRDSDVQVVACAHDGNQAVECVKSHQPDVLLLDVRMGGDGGLETLETLRNEEINTRIIMVSTFDNPTYVARSFALGADEYVLKSCTRELLLETIHRVHAGEPVPEDSLFGRVSKLMARTKPAEDDDLPLTVRESQVLRHIALGLSNREIGLSLKISVETVKEHVQNILRKIDATDRTQAAVWAVRKKIV